MINDINCFKEIVVEEAYVSLEGIHRTWYMVRIDKEGTVSEYDYQDKKYKYYNVDSEKVLDLYKNIKLFMDSIEDVEITLDDTARSMSIHYDKGYYESIASLSYDKNHKYAIDLIDDFIESSCVLCKEEDL